MLKLETIHQSMWTQPHINTNQHQLTACGVAAAGAAAFFTLALLLAPVRPLVQLKGLVQEWGTPKVHPNPWLIVMFPLSKLAFLGYLQLLEPKVLWIS